MSKMRAYDSFDAYLDDQNPSNATIIRAMRRFVARVAPSLTELVKWGYGCWLGKTGPVAYGYADKDHVQFGFFMGAKLKDPKGLLHGSGKYVRHIKVPAAAEIRKSNLAGMLKQAAEIRYGGS